MANEIRSCGPLLANKGFPSSITTIFDSYRVKTCQKKSTSTNLIAIAHQVGHSDCIDVDPSQKGGFTLKEIYDDKQDLGLGSRLNKVKSF